MLYFGFFCVDVSLLNLKYLSWQDANCKLICYELPLNAINKPVIILWSNIIVSSREQLLCSAWVVVIKDTHGAPKTLPVSLTFTVRDCRELRIYGHIEKLQYSYIQFSSFWMLLTHVHITNTFALILLYIINIFILDIWFTDAESMKK